MNTNDLKSIWHDVHKNHQTEKYPNVNMGELIRMKHSTIIARVVTDLKLKSLLYAISLILYLGLMIYAFAYLGVHLSTSTIIPLLLAGLFIFIKTMSEINRFIVFIKTADMMSMKESTSFFREKLNRIKRVDFVSYLLFFYLCAGGIFYGYLTDLKNSIWGHEMLPFLIVLCLFLLSMPWWLNHQHNQRYKDLYASLSDSATFLQEPTNEQ